MFKSMLKSMTALSACLLTLGAAAEPLRCQVALADYTMPLVPKVLVRGDREFGGNGPDIVTRAKLRTDATGTKLFAEVLFQATENPGDSETRQTFSIPIGKTARGQRIARVVSPAVSEVKFRSVKAGFQVLGPTEDVLGWVNRAAELAKKYGGEKVATAEAEGCAYAGLEDTAECEKLVTDLVRSGNGDNYVHERVPKQGPVARFYIVGDTGGPDISDDDNPKDDTRIARIAFRKITVDLEGAASCPSNF
jgi:hypothetical protein